MKTKDKLAAVLREHGLTDMAIRAEQGIYDDYESPEAMPINLLVNELIAAGQQDLANRAINGEFDGTAEESAAWFAGEGKTIIVSDILDRSAKGKAEAAREEKRNRALKPDAQAFDEIRITTVPRYKQSGLSGDEWRISAKIEFIRKGVVRHTDRANDVESAAKFLAWKLAMACDEGKAFFAGEDDICDQEGCAEKSTVTYRLKQSHCDRCAQPGSYQPKSIRKFCDAHKTRGDCGIDDSDSNYEIES
jgi:hypothetical protein